MIALGQAQAYLKVNAAAARIIMAQRHPPEYLGVRWAKLILEEENGDERSKSEPNSK